MNKQVLTACLAALVLSTGAKADTIPFFDTRFEATVIAATADAAPGFDTLSGLLADTVSLSANSAGITSIATAGAIIDLGLLTTSADVSASDISNAVATARFMGSFVNGGSVNLSLDFTGLDFATGSGIAATTLFVVLTSNGATLFSDYVHGAWQFAYAPVVGTTSLLDLTLSSDASAAFPTAGPGNASGFGMVTIAGVVPEASTWLLFSLGLGAIAAVQKTSARRKLASRGARLADRSGVLRN